MTWDVWFYRENVGWWLENESVTSLSVAGGHVARFFGENKTYDVSKFAFLILPSGKKPSDFAPRFSH